MGRKSVCLWALLAGRPSESFTANVPWIVMPTLNHMPRSSPLSMVSLNTAWEWLAKERLSSGEEAYHDLDWIDPLNSSQEETINPTPEQQSWNHVPLYPIPAVYLPVPGVNHTLNNVEPRNIQMAMDLMSKNISDGFFCLALRAADTGRIARVGSLMQFCSAEPHYGINDDEETISRIMVTCVGIEPVTIDSIENGEDAENRVSKLMKSPVYLKASVSSRRPTGKDDETNDDIVNERVDQLVKDYSFVRSMYVDGIGQEEVPLFARENIGSDLPEEWTADMFSTERSFWMAAYTWQRLCNTVREGRQVNLSADRNEIMVEAASQKGGPLKLPIHMEDLPPEVQREIQQMEVDRQKEFALKCRMDPVLDFLVLLKQSDLQNRLIHLSCMVARERNRLTEAALQVRIQAGNRAEESSNKPPQRGAWFDDDFSG